MLYPHETTTPAERQRRNDRQVLVYKRTRPDLFAKLVADLSPEALSHLEARIARMEAEEQQQQEGR